MTAATARQTAAHQRNRKARVLLARAGPPARGRRKPIELVADLAGERDPQAYRCCCFCGRWATWVACPAHEDVYWIDRLGW